MQKARRCPRPGMKCNFEIADEYQTCGDDTSGTKRSARRSGGDWSDIRQDSSVGAARRDVTDKWAGAAVGRRWGRRIRLRLRFAHGPPRVPAAARRRPAGLPPPPAGPSRPLVNLRTLEPESRRSRFPRFHRLFPTTRGKQFANDPRYFRVSVPTLRRLSTSSCTPDRNFIAGNRAERITVKPPPGVGASDGSIAPTTRPLLIFPPCMCYFPYR
ncbi:unnamed protein product [Nesidiocoris tenuis]|uniref:Uncharacterized protein n=1 Tax=Nesidiocoris tenuis TaxID=355587 RepID=A0A6H5HLX3_9HEMI|nr:unnamed protein product [Nesidiocoris tenuis]